MVLFFKVNFKNIDANKRKIATYKNFKNIWLLSTKNEQLDNEFNETMPF